MPERAHGTDARYSRDKCRCDTCKAHRRLSARAYRERRKAGTTKVGQNTYEHGTLRMYKLLGCRCAPCKAAKSVDNAKARAARLKRAAEAASKPAC